MLLIREVIHNTSFKSDYFWSPELSPAILSNAFLLNNTNQNGQKVVAAMTVPNKKAKSDDWEHFWLKSFDNQRKHLKVQLSVGTATRQ